MQRTNHAEMVALMGGHEPPLDKAGRDAYFETFESRVDPEQLGHMQLLAGIGPDAYWAWSFDRACAASRARK